MRSGPWHARPRLLLCRDALLGGRPLVRGGVAVLGPGVVTAHGPAVRPRGRAVARDGVAVLCPGGAADAPDGVAAPGRSRLIGRGLAGGARDGPLACDGVAVLGRRDLFLRRV